jgi:hypothetical protein
MNFVEKFLSVVLGCGKDVEGMMEGMGAASMSLVKTQESASWESA